MQDFLLCFFSLDEKYRFDGLFDGYSGQFLKSAIVF